MHQTQNETRAVALVMPLRAGLLADCSDQVHPAQVFGFGESEPLTIVGPGTVFGFVQMGSTTILADGYERCAQSGEYFSVAMRETLVISGGRGLAALRLAYMGLNCIGGPVEERGRLKYIDGCSDTLLIAPTILGDPCFNLLYFPPGISQTTHTHPSIRAGLIHAGRGLCRTPGREIALNVGDVFILYPDALHAFVTGPDQGMTLTVFHPDSDHGPTHDQHPMLNRTIVDGVSARDCPDIRTKVLL